MGLSREWHGYLIVQDDKSYFCSSVKKAKIYESELTGKYFVYEITGGLQHERAYKWRSENGEIIDRFGYGDRPGLKDLLKNATWDSKLKNPYIDD